MQQIQHHTDRLQELDALRGAAAASVMWFHYTVQYHELFGQSPSPWSFPPGRYGVQLFFVISGFVIFLSLARISSLWDFAANRISRLYPAYWTCVTLTFLVMLTTPLPGLNVSTGDALLNLSMFQYWLLVPHVDGAYWTLAVELVFYGLVSVIYLLGWLRHAERWIATWLAMIVLVRWGDLNGFHIPPIIRSTLLLDHGHFFFAGILFYRMKHEGFTLVRWLLLAICVFAAWYVRDVAHAASLVVSSALFLGFITGNLKWIILPPIIFLGEISYPLYLLHQNIGYVIIARLHEAGLDSPAWLFVPVIVSLALSVAVHHLVEKPAREWLRQKWKHGKLRTRLLSGCKI